jgi:hypothetical protein
MTVEPKNDERMEMFQNYVKFWRSERRFTTVEYGIMGCLAIIYAEKVLTNVDF